MTALDAAAATRGYHFEIIIGIQFGFVNVDRALLHSGSWSYLMWSSAFSWSVASLSFKLLSSTSADRRASHSSLKGPFFLIFLPRFLSEEKFTALCPQPNLLAPPLILPELNKQQPISLTQPRIMGTTVQTHVQCTGTH